MFDLKAHHLKKKKKDPAREKTLLDDGWKKPGRGINWGGGGKADAKQEKKKGGNSGYPIRIGSNSGRKRLADARQKGLLEGGGRGFRYFDE